MNRNARLIILCGNAGDGKTALLQHLFTKLGANQKCHAGQRILEKKVSKGPLVRMNLDGSASWQNKSADDLLDEFLKPFQNGTPSEDIVHLLAVNDGRLLEWIEHVEENDATPLTDELKSYLETGVASETTFLRFVNLNQRSLVGNIVSGEAGEKKVEAAFLNQLMDQFFGGEQSADLWSPCRTCTKKQHCPVFTTGRLFGPKNFPEAHPEEVRSRARERLFECFQAVHFRGDTHITIRELRAALIYILFGTDTCKDYHEGIDPIPYWDRAFSSSSPARQGAFLSEITRFDPGVEVHPKIDRYLLKKSVSDETASAPRYPDLSLPSARRRAYFEWSEENVQEIAGQTDALILARGRSLDMFRHLAIEKSWETVQKICLGISRLENLPEIAFDRTQRSDGDLATVPLRLPQKTSTDTSFWVEKRQTISFTDLGGLLQWSPFRAKKVCGTIHGRICSTI